MSSLTIRSLLLGGIFAGLGLPAAAVAKPTVSLTAPSSIDAGAPLSVSWSAARVPAGSRLVIQRQQGTARVWRTVAHVAGPGGTQPLPSVKLAIGTYRFRIADLGSHNKVLAQRQRTVHAFGDVPFSTLFTDFHDSPGVYTTPSRTFSYVDIAGDDETAFTVAHNHCRSVHFDFVPGVNGDAQSSVTGSLTVVQETLDPASASVPAETIGALDAALVPGKSWSLLTAHTGGGSGLYGVQFYLNGSANCDSTAHFS
jgi:hypothetical protein